MEIPRMVQSRRNIPFILYLLMTPLGIAAAMSLYIWLYEYSLFFGKHLVSVSTIAISILSCMAIGSRFIGVFSDKTRHAPVMFSILTGITGLFVLFDPFLFNLMTTVFHQLNLALNLGPFRVGSFRLLLTILFLLVPVALMSGVFTLLARQFIKHTDQAGKFMNAVVTSGSTGITVGLLLTTFYLIPRFGFRITQLTASFLFLFSPVAMILYLFQKRLKPPVNYTPVMALRAKKAVLRFRKKKAVLETGIKLMRAAIKVYAFQGFAVTAFLIICSRILVNYSILKPIHFYSLVTAVLMTGLALGSILFKRVAEKSANSYLTIATLQILTGLTAILSYVGLYILLKKVHDTSDEILTFNSLLADHLLLLAALILLPAVFAGAAIPIAGKIYAKNLKKTGNNFGRLGFIWFFSALTGIILTVFILIPWWGLYYSYFILVLLLLISGIYLIIRDSRLIRGFRMSYAVFSVILYFIIIGLIKTFQFDLPPSVSKGASMPVTKLEGGTATLSTLENQDGSRTVLLNNHYVFASDNPGITIQLLPAYLPLVLNNNIQSALVTGFGMGLTASTLEANGVLSIHIAEIYPEMIRFSSDIYADVNDDILTNSHVTITVEDARSFLVRSQKKLDLITTGCEQLIQAPHYYTTEFYRLSHEKLSDTGLLCQVVPLSGISYDEFRALIKACSDVFQGVSLWYLSPEKMLMIATKNTEKPEFCRISSRLDKLNQKNNLAAVEIPDTKSWLALLFLDNSQTRRLIHNAPPNHDNNPVIQYSRYIKRGTDKLISEFISNSHVNYTDFLSISNNCTSDFNRISEEATQINEKLRQQMAQPSVSRQ